MLPWTGRSLSCCNRYGFDSNGSVNDCENRRTRCRSFARQSHQLALNGLRQLASGAGIARRRETRNRFRLHSSLQAAGSTKTAGYRLASVTAIERAIGVRSGNMKRRRGHETLESAEASARG